MTKIGPEKGEEEETLKKTIPLMREKGISRVKEKITLEDFTSTVLKLEKDKSEEIQLDDLEEKLL